MNTREKGDERKKKKKSISGGAWSRRVSEHNEGEKAHRVVVCAPELGTGEKYSRLAYFRKRTKDLSEREGPERACKNQSQKTSTPVGPCKKKKNVVG